MLKKCKYIPKLETNRLALRELTENDVEDLREWLGLDEVYTYWGRTANKDERNPELLFVDARPNVNRKPSLDFIFLEAALDRLQGNADVRNVGSNKVSQKSGFQLEGTIRHGKMVPQYCDYNIWGMIKDDYRG